MTTPRRATPDSTRLRARDSDRAAVRNVRRIAVLVAAAVVAVGGIAVATGAWRGSTGTADATNSPDSAHLTTAAGFGRLLDEIRQEFGDSNVDVLNVYPEYASINRPLPGKPGMSISYQYEVDDGEARFTQAGDPSPRSSSGLPIDLTPLRPNVSTVIGLLYGADRTLAVADPTSTHISIEQDEHGPRAGIYLRNDEDGTSGFLTVGFDGELRRVRGADQ